VVGDEDMNLVFHKRFLYVDAGCASDLCSDRILMNDSARSNFFKKEARWATTIRVKRPEAGDKLDIRFLNMEYGVWPKRRATVSFASERLGRAMANDGNQCHLKFGSAVGLDQSREFEAKFPASGTRVEKKIAPRQSEKATAGAKGSKVESKVKERKKAPAPRKAITSHPAV
jgi:hypothetical protein